MKPVKASPGRGIIRQFWQPGDLHGRPELASRAYPPGAGPRPHGAVLSAATIASTGEGRSPNLPEVRRTEYLPTSSSPVQREEPLLPGPAARRGSGVPGRHAHQRRRRRRRHLPQDPRASSPLLTAVRRRVGRQPGDDPGGARPHRARPRRGRRGREPGHGRPSLRGGAVPGSPQPSSRARAQDGPERDRRGRHGDLHPGRPRRVGATRHPARLPGGQLHPGLRRAPRSSRSKRASTGSSCSSWPSRPTSIL